MADYKEAYSIDVPTGGGVYLRLKEKGEKVKIRLASDPIHYEKETEDFNTKEKKMVHRFAYIVLDKTNPDDVQVKAFEASPMVYKVFKEHALNDDWGDPRTYDFTIIRTEDKPNYYSVVPSPKHSDITKEELELIKEANMDLYKLFNINKDLGTATFSDKKETVVTGSDDTDINLEDIPF